MINHKRKKLKKVGSKLWTQLTAPAGEVVNTVHVALIEYIAFESEMIREFRLKFLLLEFWLLPVFPLVLPNACISAYYLVLACSVLLPVRHRALCRSSCGTSTAVRIRGLV